MGNKLTHSSDTKHNIQINKKYNNFISINIKRNKKKNFKNR